MGTSITCVSLMGILLPDSAKTGRRLKDIRPEEENLSAVMKEKRIGITNIKKGKGRWKEKTIWTGRRNLNNY